MSNYYPGNVIRLSVLFRSTITDQPVDPDTITLSLKHPDGTIETFVFGASTMVRASQGDYYYDYTVPTGNTGSWDYQYAGTGANTAAVQSAFVVIKSSFP